MSNPRIVQEIPATKPDRVKENDNNIVLSYLTLRNLIGICGMIMPILLYFFTTRKEGEPRYEQSISEYYYTSNGDIIVVILSVLGVFLFTYNGYNWREKALTTIAAICGLGIAFSPTGKEVVRSSSIHFANSEVPMVFGWFERHFLFAVLFFAALAIMALKYFPKTDKQTLRTEDGKMTQKAKRNLVYKICGWTIVGCIVVLALYFIIKPDVGDFPVVFTFEAIAVEAFGISWITKGESLWPDAQPFFVKAFHRARASLEA